MVDPENLTLFQRVLLESYPSNDPVFSCLMGAVERARAVAAGEIGDDGFLLPLLARLGPDCPDVDAGTAAVLHAAERAMNRAARLRDEDARKDLQRLSAALRMIAIDLWRADTESRLAEQKAALRRR